MKKNNKGFMLAEVVVTSAILLTITVSLLLTFNKVYNRYNSLATYKNIDGMYAIESFMEYIYKNENDNINKIIGQMEGKDYLYIIENNTCQNIIENTFCTTLNKSYKVTNMIITKEIKESVDKIKEEKASTSKRTLIEYLDFIKKYHPFNDYTKDSFIIIAEIIENDSENENDIIYNYSSLELR